MKFQFLHLITCWQVLRYALSSYPPFSLIFLSFPLCSFAWFHTEIFYFINPPSIRLLDLLHPAVMWFSTYHHHHQETSQALFWLFLSSTYLEMSSSGRSPFSAFLWTFSTLYLLKDMGLRSMHTEKRTSRRRHQLKYLNNDEADIKTWINRKKQHKNIPTTANSSPPQIRTRLHTRARTHRAQHIGSITMAIRKKHSICEYPY